MLSEAARYPLDSKDEEAPGFAGRIVQARKNSGLTATIARGNAHLSGRLLDPLTGDPYLNLVATTESEVVVGGDWEGTTAVAPDGTFVEEGVVNYSSDDIGFPIQDGSFTDLEEFEDKFFPGLPGSDDDELSFYSNGQNFSVELVGFLELPAGETVIGVRHDDAVEIAFHPNDARDLFRVQARGSDTNSGKADRTVRVTAPVAGLYAVRVMMAQWTGDATLEFFSQDENGNRVLINDPESEGALKFWRSTKGERRPFVAAVSPPVNDTGVERDTAISVTLMNLGEEVPVLKVNGQQVEYVVSEAGAAKTLTYQPAESFGSGQTVSLELTYGAATSKWSFVSKSGRKALLITGGGQLNAGDGWVAQRLAEKFGFDVEVVADNAVVIEDADGAALVYNSSTVNSGGPADVDFEELAIPLINVESANTDDFLMYDAGRGQGNGPASGHDTIIITDVEHPISAGIEPGEQIFATARTQYHAADPPVNSTVIAWAPDNETRSGLFAIDAGADILGDDGEEVIFTHPGRRVYFGFAGNDGAANFTEIGVKLFDQVVAWALSTKVETPFVATGIDYQGTTNRTVVTWTSQPGESFSISESVDLVTWIELDDGVEAEGESTSYSANIEGPVRYYRASKQ